MRTIHCPHCETNMEVKQTNCPNCDKTIVVFNGQEWSTMTRGEQYKVYGLFATMSTAVSWAIIALLNWMFGDFQIGTLSHEVVYYGSIAIIAFAIFRSTTGALKRGEMNS